MSVVTGAESLQQLKTSLNELLTKGEELHQKTLKEEATPDELAEMKNLREDIKTYKEAIDNFPTAEGFRDELDGTKRFLRQARTTPPPIGVQTTGGNGHGHENNNTKSFGIHVKGGDGAYERDHLKSLGDVIAEEFYKDRQADPTAAWKSGRTNQVWGREFPHFMRLDGRGFSNDAVDQEHIKATLTTSGLVSVEDRPGVTDVATQRLTIADLLARGTTSAPQYRYMRETSYTNAATPVAEGAAKPEATLALAQAVADVGKVAVWTKTSAEILEDFGSLRSFIDGRLRFMVAEREEAVLLNGNGTLPEIEGILQTTGIQTETQGSGETAAEALHQAITKIRAVGRTEPDGIVIHPTDYQILRLAKDDNGQFYGGGYAYSPYAGAGMYQTYVPLWGLRTVVTTAITAGTALVGRFMDAQLLRRSGVTLQMTNTDQDDFIKNLITMLAEARMALAVYRPLSFCTVTGLVAGTVV